jgi:DNA (cytosine-5)-methyltransferase 1
MTFIDLFAGIGGFHHALSSLGGECVMACEIDANAKVVYSSQFPDTPLVSDIRSITCLEDGTDRPREEIARLVPDHDVLCAGFPCQPFSKGGFQRGLRDKTRGTLFFDIMEIIRAKKPLFILLENVRNLIGPKHRETWELIFESLEGEGYILSREPIVFSPHLLRPEEGGAPQIRDRVFIMGLRKEIAAHPTIPLAPLVDYAASKGWCTSRWNIEDILEDDSSIPNLKDYLLRPDELGWFEAWQWLISSIPTDWLPGFPMWADDFVSLPRVQHDDPKWKKDFLIKNSAFYVENKKVIDEWKKMSWGPLKQSVDDFPLTRRKFEWQARSFQKKAKDRDIWKLVMHLRPSGIRVKPPTYLPALVAITQTPIIGARKRRITPREAAHLQGFPPGIFWAAGMPDSGAYKQLGNAVNVGVVRYMAATMFRESGLQRFRELGEQVCRQVVPESMRLQASLF